MKYFAIQLVQFDSFGNIGWVRMINDLFPSKEDAMKRGNSIGGDFYVLEFDCVKTYDGNSGEEVK